MITTAIKQTCLSYYLTSQTKPTSSTLQSQNQPRKLWQASRQFGFIFCNVDLYIQSDTAAGKESILKSSMVFSGLQIKQPVQ